MHTSAWLLRSAGKEAWKPDGSSLAGEDAELVSTLENILAVSHKVKYTLAVRLSTPTAKYFC
jgi:hypothetical protein